MSLVKLMLYGLEDGKPKYQLMKKISKKMNQFPIEALYARLRGLHRTASARSACSPSAFYMLRVRGAGC